MLKALEIVGFKSFADRTRFEFPPGITVVVGPNGSGKSNIVDAIKWALGEQSVKSLRGQEMADVIFNGSGSRRPMNSAEITLSFDNAKRHLPIDAPEVHITRRVYRGGEGEYLINRSPARLRDIRELLSGTGMGRQAYSVIEQGKVDVLLQSSAQDRRVIFEEAAGISRFKMRKVEALRRLERVEQNLLRLSDIIDEVESRLRGVRSQAGKARRYKQHADRLQELRTQVAQVDWRRLSERACPGVEDRVQTLGQEHGEALAEAENVEAQLLDSDNQLAVLAEEIRGIEAEGAAQRERIATAESTIEHERQRSGDLEQEIAHYRRQLAATSARAGDLQQQLREAADSLEAAEQHHREVARRLAEAERDVTELTASLDRCAASTSNRGPPTRNRPAGPPHGQRDRHPGEPGCGRRRRLPALFGADRGAGRRAGGAWAATRGTSAAADRARRSGPARGDRAWPMRKSNWTSSARQHGGRRKRSSPSCASARAARSSGPRSWKS